MNEEKTVYNIWKVKYGEIVYLLHCDGRITEEVWDRNQYPDLAEARTQGNIFPTRKAAEEAKDYREYICLRDALWQLDALVNGNE